MSDNSVNSQDCNSQKYPSALVAGALIYQGSTRFMARSLTRTDSHGHSQLGPDLVGVQGQQEPLQRSAGGLSVEAASEDGMGPCPRLVAASLWFGCSPGSGSPTLGPCSAADASGITHVPQAAFFCLLGTLSPGGHRGRLPATASPAAECWDPVVELKAIS